MSENMDKELDTIFDKPMGLDLRQEVKRKTKRVREPRGQQSMSFIDTIKVFFSQGFWSFTISAVGLGTIVLLLLAVWHPFEFPDAMANASNQERHVLNRVERFCFNKIAWLNDEPTCQGWLKQYRELGVYEGEIAITESELTADARKEFLAKQKRKKMEQQALAQAGLFMQAAGNSSGN